MRCSLGSPCLPRGAVCRSRLRGFPFGTRYGLSSHRNVFSKHPGVPVGLFSTKSTQYSLLQNARPPGSLRSPCGYRGAKLRVLMPPLRKGRCRTDEGRLTEGLPLAREITLGTTTPQSACGGQLPLRTETAFQAVPVLRSAYFPQRVRSTLCSKTLDLQVRCARPAGTGEPWNLPDKRWNGGQPLSHLRCQLPLTSKGSQTERPYASPV